MRTKFAKFSVLKDQISDHQATLTLFKITTEKLTFEIKKIDRPLLFDSLESSCPCLTITDIASLDQAAATLELTFIKALTAATRTLTISKPSRHATEVPKIIFDLIKSKRKARRRMCKHPSPESRSLFNNSKLWKTINKLQNHEPITTRPITLLANDVPFLDSQEIAEKFASILSVTFGVNTTLKDLPSYPKPSTYDDFTITEAELNAAIKASNKKSAPGIDAISTSIISSSPSNIKDMILLISTRKANQNTTSTIRIIF